ncbi:phytanoyl-CoA dioxygenase family protein [Myxococcus stipitatus]|uniref:phytanoyl-CoA dioxygenase family protein n=1 Tax=Myxococcus stipitatus TaxID=83455 RepID=UPI0030D17942
MLALRIHLDDCGEENGPVRVLPGTHLQGRLTEADIDDRKSRIAPVTCLARRGDVLAFHPLLLHASSPATRPGHRRVLHLEFAAATLPGGLEWRWKA